MNSQQILWRTPDHSVPQRLMNEGKLTEQEMALHPRKNELTRSISALKAHEAKRMKRKFTCTRLYEKGKPLCCVVTVSWGNVKQHELLQLVQLDSGKAELNKLVQLSTLRGNGKSDNSTAQWIRHL